MLGIEKKGSSVARTSHEPDTRQDTRETGLYPGGNRQAKGTHIGKQKGPTWGQMYTARGQSVGHRCATLLLFLDGGLATVCPLSETEAGSAGTQPARDSSADGAPRVHLAGPRPRRWPGGLLLPPLDTRVHTSENPGGFGGRAPKALPLGLLAAPWVAPLFLLVLHRLAEAVAFAIHLKDAASVRQAIQ